MGCAADAPLREQLKRARFLVGVPCLEGLGMYGEMSPQQVRALLTVKAGAAAAAGDEMDKTESDSKL
jgi:hypothetical protein